MFSQTADQIRASFFKQFSAFTQHTYLMAYAASALQYVDVGELARELHSTLEELVDDHDDRWNDELQGDSKKLEKARGDLPRFTIELCVVDLDARLHALLDDLAEMQGAKFLDSQSFENYLKPVRQRDAAVYAAVILLAEVRNSIIHGDRQLSLSRAPRLRAAGVSDDLIQEFSQKVAQGLGIGDLFRFKGAVRAAANMILEYHGSFRNKSPQS